MSDELFTQRDIDVDLADGWRHCYAVKFLAIEKRWIVVIATVDVTSAAWFLSDEKEMNRLHSNYCLFWLAETEISNWRKIQPIVNNILILESSPVK